MRLHSQGRGEEEEERERVKTSSWHVGSVWEEKSQMSTLVHIEGALWRSTFVKVSHIPVVFLSYASLSLFLFLFHTHPSQVLPYTENLRSKWQCYQCVYVCVYMCVYGCGCVTATGGGSEEWNFSLLTNDLKVCSKLHQRSTGTGLKCGLKNHTSSWAGAFLQLLFHSSSASSNGRHCKEEWNRKREK